jgi:hypothetical protein
MDCVAESLKVPRPSQDVWDHAVNVGMGKILSTPSRVVMNLPVVLLPITSHLPSVDEWAHAVLSALISSKWPTKTSLGNARPQAPVVRIVLFWSMKSNWSPEVA